LGSEGDLTRKKIVEDKTDADSAAQDNCDPSTPVPSHVHITPTIIKAPLRRA